MTRHTKSTPLPFRKSSGGRTEAQVLSDLRRLENTICLRLESLERLHPSQLTDPQRAGFVRDRQQLRIIEQLKASIEAAQPETVFH